MIIEPVIPEQSRLAHRPLKTVARIQLVTVDWSVVHLGIAVSLQMADSELKEDTPFLLCGQLFDCQDQRIAGMRGLQETIEHANVGDGCFVNRTTQFLGRTAREKERGTERVSKTVSKEIEAC